MTKKDVSIWDDGTYRKGTIIVVTVAAGQALEAGESGHTGDDRQTFGVRAKAQRGVHGGRRVGGGEQIQGGLRRVHERGEPVPGARAPRPGPSRAAFGRVLRQRRRHGKNGAAGRADVPGTVGSPAAPGLQPKFHSIGRRGFGSRCPTGAHQTAERRHRSHFAV